MGSTGRVQLSALACQEGRVLLVQGPTADALPHLFITIAFHQLDDVHMSIACEDFAHKGASGKRTSPANQLIIIPQIGLQSRVAVASQRERGA